MIKTFELYLILLFSKKILNTFLIFFTLIFILNLFEEINFFKDIYKSHKKNIKNNNKDILIYQIIRDSIDLMVRDLIKNTKNNLKTNIYDD